MTKITAVCTGTALPVFEGSSYTTPATAKCPFERGLMGLKGEKGEKGEPATNKREVRNSYLGMGKSSKNFYFLPKNLFLNNTFSMKIVLDKQIGSVQRSVIDHEEPKSIFFDQNEQNVNSCNRNQLLFGAHCQSQTYSFSVLSSHCTPSSFGPEQFCSRSGKKFNCISSVKTSKKDKSRIETIFYFNNLGENKTIEDAKCLEILQQPLSLDQSKKCGFLCSPQQLEALYKEDNSFSCVFNSPSNSFVTPFDTMQVLSTEYFCSTSDYQKEIYRQKERDFQKQESLEIKLLNQKNERKLHELEEKEENEKKDLEIQLLKEKLKEENTVEMLKEQERIEMEQVNKKLEQQQKILDRFLKQQNN